MNECIFCKIVNNQVPNYKVFENENFVAFLDINPVNPGHVDIVPKQHYGYIFDLPNNLYEKIFQVAKILAPALQSAVMAKKVGMVVEGFGVDHVHLHLIPINKGNELDPNRAKQASTEELKEMQILIKGEMK